MRKKHVIRDNIPVIIVTSIISMIGSLSIGYANNILYAGNEVSYDNSVSGLTSTTVQGALDEMCTVADFSDRVSTLESHFTNNSTSNFDGSWLRIRALNNNDTGIVIHDNSDAVRSSLRYDPTNNFTLLESRTAGASLGTGKLEIRGNPMTLNATVGSTGDINLNGNVKINGTEIYDEVDVGGLSRISSNNASLYNCTGAITINYLRYKIVGNHMVINGRIEVRVDSRTGSNPGVKITLPNSKTIRNTFDSIVTGSSVTTSGARNGEATVLTGNVDNNYFLISTSETHTNASAGQVLVFYVAQTIIPIK